MKKITSNACEYNLNVKIVFGNFSWNISLPIQYPMIPTYEKEMDGQLHFV